MRRKRTSHAIAVLLFTANVICPFLRAETPKLTSQTGVGTVDNGYQLSIHVEKSEFRPGENIDVDLIFSNVAEEDVWISEGGVMDDFEVDVTLPTGRSAPLTLYGVRMKEPGSCDTIKLPGNTSIKRTVNDLSRLFDMTRSGKYTIIAKRSVCNRNGPPWRSFVASKPIVITIATTR